MKADEIRRLIINDLFLNMDEEQATDTLERINEYAKQVSGDRLSKAFQAGRRFESWFMTRHRSEKHAQPNFNEWIKTQQQC